MPCSASSAPRGIYLANEQVPHATTTTTPARPPQSDICFAKPEGDSQCKERAKKKAQRAPAGTLLALSVLSIGRSAP